MTVCFFSTQYLPTVGGVERYTAALAGRLCRAGHRVLVVTAALPGLPATETDANGVEILRVPCVLFMNGRFPWPVPGALHRVWPHRIDFAVIQTRFYPLSAAAAVGCRWRGIPAIVIDHSTGHMPMGNALLNFAGAQYEHLAARIIRYCVSGFYGVSLAVNDWLRHFGVRPRGVLHNAVDPDELARTAGDKNWRQALGLAPDTRLIAFAGRIIPEKGAAVLVQAFRALNAPHTALVLAGDGPQLPALKADPCPGVFYPGSVPYPDLLALLRQADLFCLPTTYAEGFPTTFLEAAACGCPILTTVTGGSGELMPSPAYGRQLPDADPETWRAALAEALADDAWRQQAVRLCGERLRQHFTWDAVAAELSAIIKEYQPEGES